MIQYDEIKSSYIDSILLFRMGDFYETFGNDATLTSKLLGIVLTKRSNGKASDVNSVEIIKSRMYSVFNNSVIFTVQ